MIIRRGNVEDVTAIMEMVKNTIQIMKEEENDQWDEHYPLKTDFEADISGRSLFVAEEDGKVIGSVTVDQHEPEAYNILDFQNNTPAFLMHRLVVDVYQRGKGIAKQLIQFAEHLAIEHHCPYMKTDTYAKNKKAFSLFTSEGYTLVGEIRREEKDSPFYVFEKTLGA
ncbi:GNAT family N-acetyltransferase [Heyndrickxia ginsengihumi]|uniref:GNAT family N-acetyltransferase n=1 Tax=Heyndrickxia ginsengihumi TaxID=363870 RepID=A0A0A6VEZ6_9BACI|nr:GNAT family N-acetyltransferase [Heyndrickxia ginsengihumi]KHD86043.1 hypothetical protein NG54_05300 [Heyndrickxia ginsengihumi]MCM3023459.1 GNAT family N-acetyltransferase [Heyndrickxia ginsengihumi]NEY20385.1 GNAT family N-acetyltransferase [Heyndrickxia ginsengihumi]